MAESVCESGRYIHDLVDRRRQRGLRRAPATRVGKATSFTFPTGALDPAHDRYTFQIHVQVGDNPVLWTAPVLELRKHRFAFVATTAAASTSSNGPSGARRDRFGSCRQEAHVRDDRIQRGDDVEFKSDSRAGLYHLSGGVINHRKPVFNKKIKVGSIRYNDATRSVVIKLANAQEGPVRVVVVGSVTGSDGVTTTAEFADVVY